MDKLILEKIKRLKSGELSEKDFINFLTHLPYKDLGNIKLDFHRQIRRGLPEVIYGKEKTSDQLEKIINKYIELDVSILITKVEPDKFGLLGKKFSEIIYHKTARIITFKKKPEVSYSTPVLILSAGSSDEQIAEEAYISALYLGNKVEKEYDVGVACLQRIIDLKEKLNNYGIIIVIAGMEGALPSVVAGLTSTPVVAVPTSIGYGANFSGMAALLSMLNSCSGGVTVVNIDNGFGAAYAATLINQKISHNRG